MKRPLTTRESGPPLPDLLTVIAIALVAYSVSGVLHEAVGHGGACVALGGKPLVLSSVHFECDEKSMSPLARRCVSAAGTVANFAGGLLSCVSGLFNPVGPILIAISAAAASFGGTSGLLWLTEFLGGAEHSAEGADLGRSYVWISAAGVVSLIDVAILGPGIRF